MKTYKVFTYPSYYPSTTTVTNDLVDGSKTVFIVRGELLVPEAGENAPLIFVDGGGIVTAIFRQYKQVIQVLTEDQE